MAERTNDFAGLFPATRWSLVGRARSEDVAGPRPALDELLRRYLPALRAHLQGRSPADPSHLDDLLQGFIASKVLEADLLDSANPRKGKFRTLLLTALDRYIISQHRYDHSQKRDRSKDVALDSAIEWTPASGSPRTDSFDVAWARQVLSEALGRMRRECDSIARPDLWTVFEMRIVKPTLEGIEPGDYGQLVKQLGYRSPTQAWNALITAKRTFVRILHAVVREYAGDEGDVEAEIRDLWEILSRAGG